MVLPFYNKEKTQYSPLGNTNGSSDDVNSDSQLHQAQLENTTRQVPWRNAWFRLSTLLNVISIVIFCILGFSHYRHSTRLNSELRQSSTYSPIYDRIDLELQTKLTNGTFYPKKHDASIARQRPSPEIDEIWEEWGVARVVPVTRADIIKMGKDPSIVAKLEDKDWGLGDDAYAATLDIFHQLHCVNTLRRIAYGNYYNDTIMELKAENQTRQEIHLNHCVDMLMQTIQCTGNLNLITMNWVEYGKHPFPDMSANRKCVNFDKLTEWRKKNTIDMDRYVEVMGEAPEGAQKAPMADAYFEESGLENPNHLNGANPGIEFNI